MSAALEINPNGINNRNGGLNANQPPANQANWQGRNVHQIDDIENPPEPDFAWNAVMADQRNRNKRKRHLKYFLTAFRIVGSLTVPLLIAGIVLMCPQQDHTKGVILLASGSSILVCAWVSGTLVYHRIEAL